MPNCKNVKEGFTFQDETHRMNFNADPEVHAFFVRKVFAGERGAIASLCNQLLRKLYDICQAEGVSPEWDIDGENQKQVQIIIDNISYESNKSRRPARRPTQRKQKPAPCDSK
jgi:hypothetical protein